MARDEWGYPDPPDPPSWWKLIERLVAIALLGVIAFTVMQL